MFKFSCSPGKYNDGTGTAENPSAANDPAAKIKRNAALSVQKKFRDALSNPYNLAFRNALLAKSGLAGTAGCESADKLSSDCLDRLAGTATGLVMKDIKQDPITNFLGADRITDETKIRNSLIFKQISQTTLDDVKKSMGTDKVDAKIEDTIFPRVKDLLISKIDRMISDPDLKQSIINKITAIHYSGGKCTKGGETINTILEPNAFYDPDANTFAYCSGVSSVKNSEFGMVWMIAHELSHSFDPCSIAQKTSFSYKSTDPLEQQNEFPFKGVLGCLKSQIDLSDSVSRKPPSASQVGKPYACTGGSAQKLNEAFADWSADEVLPDYMQQYQSGLTRNQSRIGYSNVLRGLCSNSMFSGGKDHPSDQQRVDKLLLVQPKIRQQMGCSADVPSGRQYCVYGTNSTAPVQDGNGSSPAVPQGAVK